MKLDGRLKVKSAYYYRRLRAFIGKGIVVSKTKVVVDSPDDVCERPVFLVGTHRSGTSLMRRVVDSHPNIACPPESYFLAHFSPLWEDKKAWAGLNNLGYDEAQAKKSLRYLAGYFHEGYRRAKGKPRWADKDPSYVFHLETLFNLFGEQAQFVIIQRNPLDVAFSIYSRGWRLMKLDDDLFVNSCLYVKKSMESYLQFATDHPHSVYRLKYEDVITNPEAELRKLCGYLDEPFSQQMLEHHKVSHDFGTEDPIARGTSGFRGSVGNWRQLEEDKQAVGKELLGELMGSLGYGID